MYAGDMQVHGFARNVDWEVTKTADGDAPMVEMTLLPSDYTKAMWPADFKATQTITLKDGALTATMSVRAVWSYAALELAVVDDGTCTCTTRPQLRSLRSSYAPVMPLWSAETDQTRLLGR